MAVTVANTRKRILPVWMNWYGKKPLIFFKHLSETNKISKNHQNWLRIVDRRHFQRFQTGFSHPVDPEIRIFFCPWQSTLKSLSLETLFAFLGGLQPSKRGGLDLEISRDSLLCVCIDQPLYPLTQWRLEKSFSNKLDLTRTTGRNATIKIRS